MLEDHCPRRSVLALVTAGALLAGWGGSDDEPSSTAGGGGGTTTPAAGASPKTGTVGMKNIEFVPRRTSVKVGEEVTWRNDEAVDHNVVAQEGANFKSRAFGQGGTYAFTPKRPGKIKYVCTLHPGMDGELVVERR